MFRYPSVVPEVSPVSLSVSTRLPTQDVDVCVADAADAPATPTPPANRTVAPSTRMPCAMCLMCLPVPRGDRGRATADPVPVRLARPVFESEFRLAAADSVAIALR